MLQSFVKYYKFLLLMSLVLGVFFLPFIFWPWAAIPFEIPRVWFVQRWIETIGVVGLVLSFFLPLSRRVDTKGIVLVIGLVGVAVIASFFGVDWQKSLWGNYYRIDGLLTLFHLTGLFFFVVLYWQDSWKRALSLAFAGGSILVSVWAVLDAFRQLILPDFAISPWGGAVGATFGQPNFLAGYLVVTLPFVYYCYERRLHPSPKLLPKSWRTREDIWPRIWLVGGALQLFAIGLTYSLGSILGVILFAGSLIVIKYKKHVLIPISGIVFFVLLVVLSFIFLERAQAYVPESRERIFRKVLLSTWQRPILGWGWANVDHAFDASVWPIPYLHDVYVDKAHSTLLEVFATTGIVGLFIYVLVIFYFGKKLYKAAHGEGKNTWWHKTIFLVFLLYLFHSQTNVLSIAEEVVFWIVLGIAASETTS